jgi:pimeloyl-ACP methyl ester carboxylesterase
MAPPLITLNEGTSGDTVLVVHGTMDRCASFRSVARYLPEWTVVGWDRRGWGGSADLGGPATTLDDHVDDLCELAADLPVTVVAGHSYGGLVALCAAARRPDLVPAVVAFEPPVRWLPWWPREAPWDQLARTASSPAEAASAMLRSVLGEQAWERLHDSSRAKLLAGGPTLLVEMNDPVQDLPAFDPVELAVAVVTGSGERSQPHHIEVSRRLAALVANGEHVRIAGGGHAAHVSHPRDFADLVCRAAALAGVRT